MENTSNTKLILTHTPTPQQRSAGIALARATFLLVGKSEHMAVAILDKQVVGVLIMGLNQLGQYPIGTLDYLAVKSGIKGQGIGKQLVAHGMHYLQDLGATLMVTTVQDDNVASWSLFTGQGFVRTSFLKLAKQLGMVKALRAQFYCVFMMFAGGDMYMKTTEPEQTALYENQDATLVQLLVYLLTNMGLGLFFLSRNPALGWQGLLPLLIVFLLFIFLGWLGTCWHRKHWQFRMPQGGWLVVGWVSIWQFWPMIANWYPRNYEPTPYFRRMMGLQSLTRWAGLLAIFVLLIDSGHHQVQGFIGHFLLFQCFSVTPFAAMGGRRVRDWSQGLFLLFASLSLGLIYLTTNHVGLIVFFSGLVLVGEIIRATQRLSKVK